MPSAGRAISAYPDRIILDLPSYFRVDSHPKGSRFSWHDELPRDESDLAYDGTIRCCRARWVVHHNHGIENSSSECTYHICCCCCCRRQKFNTMIVSHKECELANATQRNAHTYTHHRRPLFCCVTYPRVHMRAKRTNCSTGMA